MARTISGRCHRCKIRFTWEGKPRLKDAYCPYCQAKLELTTHLWQGKTEHRRPCIKVGQFRFVSDPNGDVEIVQEEGPHV